MKKYVMGIAALLLGVCFSAFTTISNPAPSKQKLDNLFWYFYNSSTGALEGQIGEGEISHETAKAATPCEDDMYSTIDCARGYVLAQDPYEDEPGAGDEQVKRVDD